MGTRERFRVRVSHDERNEITGRETSGWVGRNRTPRILREQENEEASVRLGVVASMQREGFGQNVRKTKREREKERRMTAGSVRRRVGAANRVVLRKPFINLDPSSSSIESHSRPTRPP